MERATHAVDLATEIAGRLVAAPHLWAGLADHTDDHRDHVRLVATDSWEAWVITWPPGFGVELHDHGGSAGAVAVAHGELVEVSSSRRASIEGHTRRVRRVPLAAGTVHPVPARRIHDVINVAAQPATSVHVYAGPLRTMTFYDPLTLRPTRTEQVFPEDPLLAPAAVVPLLHPSHLGRD